MKFGNTLMFPSNVSDVLILVAYFYYFCPIDEVEMKKNKSIITLLAMLILTVLAVFLSCRYATQVKNEQVLETVYLFSQAVDSEKELMHPGLIFFPESKTEIRSDSTVIETEKEKTVYKRIVLQCFRKESGFSRCT